MAIAPAIRTGRVVIGLVALRAEAHSGEATYRLRTRARASLLRTVAPDEHRSFDASRPNAAVADRPTTIAF
jgi:hypothetical protein